MLRDQKSRNRIVNSRLIICRLFFVIVLLLGVLCVTQSSYAYWVEEEEGIKYLQEDGQYAIGFIDVEEKRYYFDTDGHLVTGKFYVEEEDSYYYSDESGVLQYGAIHTEDDFFITDDNGKLLTGFAEHDGKRYYFNEIAQMVVGWFKYEDDWYYADSNGIIQTGFVNVDGYRYYLNPDGTRVSDAILEIEGVTYIFNADGSVDENATLTYPIFQHINNMRIQCGKPELLLNSKVQACALLRASDLVNGFSLEDAAPLESLLANRGVRCSGGYEFAFGGIEGYDFQKLTADMQKDNNIWNIVLDSNISEVGIGMYEEDDVIYYSILFVDTDSSTPNEKE